MDLIERQDAIDAIKKCRNESDMPDMWYDGMSCALRCIYQLSSSQPKSYREGYQAGFKDAQPERKKGKWIKARGWCTPGGDPVWECSECGKGIHVYGIEWRSYGGDVADGQWVSCPNCGARMEVDDETD